MNKLAFLFFYDDEYGSFDFVGIFTDEQTLNESWNLLKAQCKINQDLLNWDAELSKVKKELGEEASLCGDLYYWKWVEIGKNYFIREEVTERSNLYYCVNGCGKTFTLDEAREDRCPFCLSTRMAPYTT